jgi:hypothetical protein
VADDDYTQSANSPQVQNIKTSSDKFCDLSEFEVVGRFLEVDEKHFRASHNSAPWLAFVLD